MCMSTHSEYNCGQYIKDKTTAFIGSCVTFERNIMSVPSCNQTKKQKYRKNCAFDLKWRRWVSVNCIWSSNLRMFFFFGSLDLKIHMILIQEKNDWLLFNFTASGNPDDEVEVISGGGGSQQPGYQPPNPSVPSIPNYPQIPTIPSIPSVPVYPSYPYPAYPSYPSYPIYPTYSTYFPLSWSYNSVYNGFSSEYTKRWMKTAVV